jgi:sugar phosphate isomerase/epimerase
MVKKPFPREGPRTFTDRASLGEGLIDFSPILRGLHEGGYRGTYCLEILSDEGLPDSLWRLSPEDLLRKNIQAFHHLWKRATEEVPA